MNKLEQLNEAEKNMFKSLVNDARTVAKRVWLYSPYRKRYLVGIKKWDYRIEKRIVILGYYNPDEAIDPEKKEIIIDDSYEQANQQFAELSLKSETFVH